MNIFFFIFFIIKYCYVIVYICRCNINELRWIIFELYICCIDFYDSEYGEFFDFVLFKLEKI